MNTSDWLALLNSIATLSAAAGATFITYKIGKGQREIAERQAETAVAEATTARNKLKLDLFARRIVVYESAVEAVRYAMQHRDFPHAEDAKFLNGIASAQWIFSAEIDKFLREELWKTLMDLWDCNDFIQLGERQNLDVTKRHEEKEEQMRKVALLPKKIDQKFAEYLQLDA